MHLGMPECHKPFWGHCDLDLWPSFQELLCPEHISYIIWCRNPKFGVVIPLGMAEWCIQFWVILTLTLTSGFISRFFLLYYSYLSSNVSCARPIPLGAFVTCLWHFLFELCTWSFWTSFHSDIQNCCHDGHLETFKTLFPLKRYVGLYWNSAGQSSFGNQGTKIFQYCT